LPDKRPVSNSQSRSAWGDFIIYRIKGVSDMDKPKIKFINSSYETLFTVDDGKDLEIEIDNGWKRFPCYYIDEFHFKLDTRVYHIYEFALLGERNVCRYRPAEAPLDHDNV
jgi:hypothetical protein